MLMLIHSMLLGTPMLAAILERAECRHISGHASVAADIASRGRMTALMRLCAQAHIRAENITPHPIREALLEQAVTAMAERRGLEVAPAPQHLSHKSDLESSPGLISRLATRWGSGRALTRIQRSHTSGAIAERVGGVGAWSSLGL